MCAVFINPSLQQISVQTKSNSEPVFIKLQMELIKQIHVNTWIQGTILQREADSTSYSGMFSVIMYINRDLNISAIMGVIAMQKKPWSCAGKVLKSIFVMKVYPPKEKKENSYSYISWSIFLGFQMVLVVKNLPANAGDVQSLGQEELLENCMATSSSSFA